MFTTVSLLVDQSQHLRADVMAVMGLEEGARGSSGLATLCH